MDDWLPIISNICDHMWDEKCKYRVQWNEKYEKVIGRKMTHLVSFMFYLKKKSQQVVFVSH